MKPIEGVRPADKVLQALATLAALIDSTIREVKSLDSEFQARLMQAVHDTEASLQEQTAGHIESARREVQDELKARFQTDIQAAMDGLKAEFEIERRRFKKELDQAIDADSKLKSEMLALTAEVQQVKADSAAEVEKAMKAVHETEVRLQAQAADSLGHATQKVQGELASRHQKELQSALDALKSEFAIERERVGKEFKQLKDNSSAELQQTREAGQKALDALKAEFAGERERLNKELEHTVGVASKLEAERSGLIAEVDRVKNDSAKTVAAKPTGPSTPAALSASLKQEIESAETRLQEILKIIDNPTTELSTVIRKNVEKSELEAFLRGIRLVVDGKK